MLGGRESSCPARRGLRGMAEPTVIVLVAVLFFVSYSIASPLPSAQGPSAAGPAPSWRQSVGAPSPSVTGPSSQPSHLAPAPSPSSSPTPTSDCTTVVIDNLFPCLTFVEKGSNVTVPDKGCCRGLAAVVSAQPMCLCQLLGGGGTAIPVDIDRTRALTLPTVCRVQTPPVSMCAVMGVPISSPVFAPAPAPSASTHQGSPAGPSAAGPPPRPNCGATASRRPMLAEAFAIAGTMLLGIAAF